MNLLNSQYEREMEKLLQDKSQILDIDALPTEIML